MNSGGNSTISSNAVTRRSASALVCASPCTRRGTSSVCRTVRRGFNDDPGSWNTTWIAFLIAGTPRRTAGSAMSYPRNHIDPAVGR